MAKRKLFKVRLILEHKGHLLMLKQTNQNGGKYTLVGGNVEEDEFPIRALIRESEEEAGISLREKDLELVHTLFKRKANDLRVVMYFKAVRWKGELEARERDKFKKVAWFPIDNLPKNTSNTVKYMLNYYSYAQPYSELAK